jgi:protein ImuA
MASGEQTFAPDAGAANRIARLREELRAAEATSFGEGGAPLALGIPAIDDALGGGLARGALHEIAAAREPESAAATGFALALATRSNQVAVSEQAPHSPGLMLRRRLKRVNARLRRAMAPSRSMSGVPKNSHSRIFGVPRPPSSFETLATLAPQDEGGRKTVVWIAEDLSLAENGTLYGPGLDEVGIAPEQLITITVARGRDVLWAMEEALRCRAVGVVIGEMRAHDIDQVATRRLSLAAAAGNALGLFLRTAPNDDHSAAVTRWIIGAAPSASPTGRGRGVGAPRLIARLVRNRRGQLGTWIVEWNSVEQRFELATDSEPVVGPAFDRSHRTVA